MNKEEFLIFRMFGILYGARLSRVREIITYAGRITPLPYNPVWVLGVINLRGEVTPVIDFRRKFSDIEPIYDAESIIIALRVKGDRVMAIMVDSVETIAEFDPDLLQKASDIGSGLDPAFLEGLAQIKDEMVSIIDVDTMLDVNKI
ncbi:MAG: chemotaxis protein CheW [Helicobacteraceae bacterium]|nr:chemotaxis protein CheW [Helicobacteraceae bacterium]